MATLVRPQYVQRWMAPGPLAGHAEDRAYLFSPRLGVVGGPAMIWCHGALLNATFIPSADAAAVYEFIGRLCSIGVTVLVPDIGDPAVSVGPTGVNPWGNPTSTARVEAWRQWMAANLPCDASKVTLLGFSMGGCTSLGYARDYPSKVLAVSTWLGAYDLVAIRASRGNGTAMAAFAPMIDAAYAITSTDPLPAGMDPYSNTTLQGLKWRGYYRNDATPDAPPDWATRMAAWTGGRALPISTLTSHTMASVGEPCTDFDEWCSWAGVP